jgi:sulfur-carrier protein
MKLRVRYFASLREALGEHEPVEMPAGSTVGDLRQRLRAGGETHARLLAEGRAVRCALNQRLCDETAALAEGAEVAFFPPVTGG